jgi:hypothetical protein
MSKRQVKYAPNVSLPIWSSKDYEIATDNAAPLISYLCRASARLACLYFRKNYTDKNIK